MTNSFADLEEKMVPSRINGRFLLGYSHGKALAVANLVHVWYGQEETSDWAIVKIDRCVRLCGNASQLIHICRFRRGTPARNSGRARPRSTCPSTQPFSTMPIHTNKQQNTHAVSAPHVHPLNLHQPHTRHRNLGHEFGHLVPSPANITAMLPYERAFSMTAYSRDKYEFQVRKSQLLWSTGWYLVD